MALESLLHLDGVNGSNTITDATGLHAWVANGGTALDTSQQKFGTASVKGPWITGDGTIAWGGQDFTIDFWVNVDAAMSGSQVRLFSTSNGNFFIYLHSVTKAITYFVTSIDAISGTTTLTFNVWHHVALTRQGNNHYLFLDGHLEGTWSNAVNYGTSSTNFPYIGDPTYYMNPGWIDEVRIVLGTAAWTSNFSVPTSAYSLSGGTQYNISSLLAGSGALTDNLTVHSAAASAQALAYVALGRGMFIHFNMPTFIGADLIDANYPPNTFNPTGLNVGQWIDVAVSMGAKYATLTIKHQDGFCLWPTTTTTQGVANTTWYASHGNPDMVQMFVDACRAKGILPCFYFNIGDQNWTTAHPGYTNAQFQTFAEAQITEVLTRYGPVTALWLDSTEWFMGGPAPWTSTTARNNFIHGVQPGIVVVDNGHTNSLVDSDVIEYESAIISTPNTAPAESCFTVLSSWFWQSDTQPVTDAGTLAGYIIQANTNNGTCLLNFPPNTAGVINAALTTRAAQIPMVLGETPRQSPNNMTSDTAPAPYVASASSEYPGSAAFNAFNGPAGSFWSSNQGSLPAYIEIDLGSVKAVSQYTVQARLGGIVNQWTAWTLAGSNDGSSWTTLDTRSQAVVPAGEVDFFTLAAPASYRYWRWTITGSNTGINADVGNLALYPAAASAPQTYALSATFAGTGTLAAALKQIESLSVRFAGSGAFTPNAVQRSRFQAALAGASALAATPVVPHTYSIAAALAGVEAGAGSVTFRGPGTLWDISNIFSGGLIDPDTGLPYGTWHGRGRISATSGRMMGIFAQFSGEGNCAVTTTWLQGDFIWPGIVEDAGEQVLYRQAAGLEKSLATVDAYRLTQTYAELIRDQWDPYRISSTNLPYLAWAMGVNLWEDTWSEEFKRYWVANQWTMKYERGSAKGLNDFVDTVNASPGMHAEIVNLIVPPACFYPGKALTEAERLAYVARFPQLRLYPYAPRPKLPYLGYLGGFSLTRSGQKIFVKNGRFLGPLLKFYPTNYNAGGDYLRSATLYEPQTGVETQLTVRTIRAAPQPGQKEITYDEISLSSISGNLFYPGRNKKYLLSKHPITQKLKYAVVLGRLPYTPSRLVRVPRDGTLDRTQFQALFTTIGTGLDPINVRPEHVYQQHPTRQLEWYCGMPLSRTYLTKSNAWQFLYERWYLFDPTRLPDNRKASTYMGRSRFGIHKYTAEADIQAWFTWPKFYARANGYYGNGRFFPPKNTKLIDQIRRAVTASMAVRDTIQIDTGIKRTIQIRDLTVLDGRFSIGQYVTDRTA